MSLPLGAGVCTGHPCDHCARCAAAECCGEGVRDDALPAVGSWRGRMYGRLGSLAWDVDGLVLCHICGLAFRALGAHIGPAHGVTADEYRSYFGLCTGTGLTSMETYEQRVRAGKAQAARGLIDGAALAQWNEHATAEQRALVSFERNRRPEHRRRAYASDAQRRKALRRSALFAGDPARREHMALLLRRAKRGDDPGRECPECGALFCTWISHGGRQRSKATTCLSPECIRAARSRAGKLGSAR